MATPFARWVTPEEPAQVDSGDRGVVGRGVVGERLGNEYVRVVDQGVDAPNRSSAAPMIRSAVAGSAMRWGSPVVRSLIRAGFYGMTCLFDN